STSRSTGRARSSRRRTARVVDSSSSGVSSRSTRTDDARWAKGAAPGDAAPAELRDAGAGPDVERDDLVALDADDRLAACGRGLLAELRRGVLARLARFGAFPERDDDAVTGASVDEEEHALPAVQRTRSRQDRL